MADFSQNAWRLHVAPLAEPERRQSMRDLASGVHRIIGVTGQPLNFNAPVSTATVAAQPPNVERKIHAPHYGNPASVDRPASLASSVAPEGSQPRLSEDDKRGFAAFAKSFDKLPPTERSAAMQKLAEIYIPRLIHE